VTPGHSNSNLSTSARFYEIFEIAKRLIILFHIMCEKIVMCDLLVNLLLQVNGQKTLIFVTFFLENPENRQFFTIDLQ